MSMRRFAICLPLLAALATPVAHAAQPTAQQTQNAHDEGLAAGRSSLPAIRGMTTGSSAAQVVPGYGTQSGATQYYGSNNQTIQNAAQQRRAQCAAQAASGGPVDADCEAANNAASSAGQPRDRPSDDTVLQAKQIGNDPGSTLGAVAGSYTGCTTETRIVRTTFQDIQACYQYLLRALDQLCVKQLNVTVDWTCDPGWDGPYKGADGAPHYCERYDPVPVYRCDPPATGLTYIDGLGWYCQVPTGTGTEWTWQPATFDHFDYVYESESATPIVTDTWDNGCAGYEARVPPGLLPPDGDAAPLVPLEPTGPGPIDKCERASSVCTQPKQTRIINDLPVTRNCWQYTNTFNCVNLDPRSDCNQPRFGDSCQQNGPPVCIDYDAFIVPQVCNAYRYSFLCQENIQQTQTVANCTGQQYCENGTCWDTGYPPDKDYAMAVTATEIGREGGLYMNPNLRVFSGVDCRCTKKLFGLVNCCTRSGLRTAGMFTNLAVELGLRPQNPRDASSYSFDVLFATQKPGFFGFNPQMSPIQFIESTIPGFWQMMAPIWQLTGLVDCSDDEKALALRRDSRLCVDIGEYCSRRLPIIRTCIEQTHSYCCFNSHLARIINEQGRAQLGKGWGSAESPDCSGFSIAEIQRLDFSRMDFSEFYAEVVAQVPDAGTVQQQVTTQIQNCRAAGQAGCQ